MFFYAIDVVYSCLIFLYFILHTNDLCVLIFVLHFFFRFVFGCVFSHMLFNGVICECRMFINEQRKKVFLIVPGFKIGFSFFTFVIIHIHMCESVFFVYQLQGVAKSMRKHFSSISWNSAKTIFFGK